MVTVGLGGGSSGSGHGNLVAEPLDGGGGRGFEPVVSYFQPVDLSGDDGDSSFVLFQSQFACKQGLNT